MENTTISMYKKLLLAAVFCSIPVAMHGMDAFYEKIASLYDMVTGKGSHFKPVFTRGAGLFTGPKDELSRSFFGMLAEEQTQREHWYRVSPYISEFACSISNLGFLYVGYKHGSWRVAGAGLASMLYHSYPKQWALWLDRIGAAAGISLLVEHRTTALKNIGTLALPLGIALAALIADVNIFGQSEIMQPWVHAFWHLSAAYAADRLLTEVESEKEKLTS